MSGTQARTKKSLPRFGGGSSGETAARFAQPLAPLGPEVGSVVGSAPSSGSDRAPTAHVSPGARPAALSVSTQMRPEDATAVPARDLAALQADRPRSIAISTRLMSLVGDAAAGVFLSQLVFWSRYGTEVVEREGWIFKTAQDWERETSLSWKAQRRARTILLRLGLIEERRLSMPARLVFRLRLATIVAALGPGLATAADSAAVDWFAWQAAMPDGTPSIAEMLLGRGFLFHAALAAPLTLTGAMMCSRLMAGVRWNGRGPVIPSASGSSVCTRFVGMPRSRWQLETGLSRDQWQTARKRLREAGVLAERFANYPRRVDLAIHLNALAHLLKTNEAGAPSAHAARNRREDGRKDRRDWEKQAAVAPVSPNPAFNDRPNLPTESPDPAFSNRPILPLAIAQPRLYLSESQAMTPQPPPPRERAHKAPSGGSAAMAFGWGGGGGLAGYGITRVAFGDLQGRNELDPPKQSTVSAPAVAQGELHWPASFTAGDREQASRHLAGLAKAVQQAVLDEVQWAHQSGSVRSPVGLTRSLAGKARSGAFAPDGAHRVAEARAAREAHDRRLAATAPAAPPPDQAKVERTPEQEERYQANRDRLKQVTDSLRKRVG